MRRATLLLCLLMPTLLAQDSVTDDAVFPATWEGVWKGPCAVHREGKADLKFPMELHVKPLDGGRWTWHIKYGEQRRPYELVPVAGNHFVIDEKNSIFIDAYLENDRLHSRFNIGGSSIEVTYARRGDTMDVTLTTFSVKPARTSGGEGRIPAVTAHRLMAVQRATLKR